MVKNKKIISSIMAFSIIIALSSTVLASPYMPQIGGGGLGMESIVNGLLGLLQVAGYGVAFGMLFYVGIKYVMASANEKADLKNSSIKYFIGAIIIFGASFIFDVIFSAISEGT